MTSTKTPTPAPTHVEPAPRRSWLALGVVIALIAVAAGALGWWLGSSDTPAQGAPDVVDRWADGWLAGDAVAVAETYAEDGIHAEVRVDDPVSIRNVTMEGRTEYLSHFTGGMPYVEFTELDRTHVSVFENIVVVEWNWTGMSSDGVRAFDDKTPFDTWGVTIFEIENDLIERATLYYNASELFN